MTRYVLLDENAGIFLGESQGFPCWSRWKTDGFQYAVTFVHPEIAMEFMRLPRHDRRYFPMTCQAVPVKCWDIYATIKECADAGLPEWNPE